MFLADLTLSFLGKESDLMSSFLSGEELNDLQDKVCTVLFIVWCTYLSNILNIYI